MKCDNCGKGIMVGHNVSHAKNRTRRIFKPNLHPVRIWTGSGFRKMRLCTKCQRLLKKKSVLSIKKQVLSEVPQETSVVAPV